MQTALNPRPEELRVLELDLCVGKGRLWPNTNPLYAYNQIVVC